MTKAELQSQFHTLSGFKADGRWSVQKLTEEVDELRKKDAERKAAVAEREEQDRLAHEERLARIEARGPLDEFVKSRHNETLSESDRKFASKLRRAVSVIECEQKELKKFAEQVVENPTHALSWSKGLFVLVAEAVVAREMVNWFERGGTFEGWVTHATKTALAKGRSPSMSTSPTSNLMDTFVAAAWADVAEDRWF